MAEKIRPFDTPGTYFHNYTLDTIMPALSPNAWKVLCVAIRQTWGWVDKESPTGRKESDVISYSQFMEKTGIGGRSTLSRALSECLDAGYLTRHQVGEHQGTRRPIYSYSLNTDYEVAGPEMGPEEAASPKTGPAERASPKTGPEEVASPKMGPGASPETGPAKTASPKTGPATGPKTRPAASPKTGLTKEKEIKQTNNGGGGGDRVREDERIAAVVDLAQDLRQPLDLGRAHAMVQPYSAEQVRGLVRYARQAEGLRSPLGFVFERLKTGELPILPAPQPRPDYVAEPFPEPEPEPPPRDPALAEAQQLWQTALGDLKLQMTQETFTMWLKPTRVVAREDSVPFDEARSTGSRHGHGVLYVEVENRYVKEWLANRLMGTIERTVNDVAGEPIAIEFVVKAADGEGGEEEPAPP